VAGLICSECFARKGRTELVVPGRVDAATHFGVWSMDDEEITPRPIIQDFLIAVALWASIGLIAWLANGW